MGAAGHRQAGTPAPRHGHPWPWRRNPLRTRGHNRHRVFVAVLLIALCAVPAVAFLLSRAEYDTSAAERRDQLASTRTTQAIAKQDVYGGGARGPWGGGDAAVPATVSWTAADGTEHTATALVDPPVRLGETTTIWLDQNGNPTHQPDSRVKPALDAVSLGVVVMFGGAGVLLIVYATEHTLFMRSRMHAWAREWAEIAPRWTADA